MKKKSLLICTFFTVVFGFNYFWLLPLNVRYMSTVTLIMLSIVYVLIVINPKNMIESKMIEVFNVNGKSTYSSVPMLGKRFLYILLSFICVNIVYGIFSSSLIFSDDYKNLIGVVEEQPFDSEFIFNDINQLPIIDSGVAKILGDKKIGEDRGLGSEFRVGEFYDIIYNEEPYAVAPLEFNDFFKWFNNQTTPGYVLVNKITGDTQLIRQINGVDLELKYLPSAYFNNDLLRHVYFNSNTDNSLSSYRFEIDDDGNPYWVISKTKKTIGISAGAEVYEVVLVNAVTGEISNYDIDEVPSFVDVIYPSELILKQVDDWGYYVNGFMNTLFSEKEIIRITDGSRRLYHNGEIYHYTGMTSAGLDESTVGFVFVSARTKETLFYTITGATEKAAMASAEGKVQNLRYNASFPIPVNIDGVPTFFMTLKDDNGLIKQYAFVNIDDYGKVSVSDDLLDARSSYLMLLNKEDSSSQLITYEGKIDRIGYSNNNYYLILDGYDNLFYCDNNEINKLLAISNENDYIKIEVLNDSIKKFENETVGKKI